MDRRSSDHRKRQRIISLNIDLVSYNEALNQIISCAKSKTGGYVCFANVHMIIEAYHSRSFADQVNGSMLVLADGMPIINVLNSSYGHKQERVAGMDVMPDLIRLAEKEKLKIYFFGTTNEMLSKIKIRTKSLFPNVEIAGCFAPPFDRSLDDDVYVQQINDSGADLLFVALGCPKQENWMARHSHKINAILLGVGGAFPLYAGTTRRAPEWLRNLSLEWAFRLGQEPSRLFKRYLKTNSLFLYLVFQEKVKRFLQMSGQSRQEQ